MAKKKSAPDSTKSKVVRVAKQGALLAAIGVGATMIERYREGKVLNPFAGAFWS